MCGILAAMNTVPANMTTPTTAADAPPPGVLPDDSAVMGKDDASTGYVTSRTAVSAEEDSEEIRDLFFGC